MTSKCSQHKIYTCASNVAYGEPESPQLIVGAQMEHIRWAACFVTGLGIVLPGRRVHDSIEAIWVVSIDELVPMLTKLECHQHIDGRTPCYFGSTDQDRTGWLRLEHSESNRGNFETNSVAEPEANVKSERTGIMWQNRGFCATTQEHRVFWTRLKTDLKQMCQIRRASCRNQVGSQLLLQLMVFEASVVREVRMWRRARIWK